MPEESTIIQHRLPSEGADYLLLAGVNDANLQELARLSGCRVILRGDYLILSGELVDVERAIPAAQQLIDMARLHTPFGVEDVRRIGETMGPRGTAGARRADAARVDGGTAVAGGEARPRRVCAARTCASCCLVCAR